MGCEVSQQFQPGLKGFKGKLLGNFDMKLNWSFDKTFKQEF